MEKIITEMTPVQNLTDVNEFADFLGNLEGSRKAIVTQLQQVTLEKEGILHIVRF